MDKHLLLKENLKNMIKDLGFELVSFLSLKEVENDIKDKYLKWLEKGYHAEMNYMENNIEVRFNIKNLLKEYNSMIVLGLNYYQDKREGFGKNISVYAYGRDYHKTIKGKLKKIIAFLKRNGIKARGFTDSAPILEKYLAQKAGLGWQGKNSLIINRKLGSYFFLAEILTDFDFKEKPKIVTEHCGKCRRCMDACPTGAIVEDKIIDSNKCISYLTIEYKGDLEKEMALKMQDLIFGCDICQEVCPWNGKIIQTKELDFKYRYTGIDLSDLKFLKEEEFKEFFKGSPIKRAGFKHFKRQIERVLNKD